MPFVALILPILGDAYPTMRVIYALPNSLGDTRYLEALMPSHQGFSDPHSTSPECVP